jgi:hypothetical protein
MDAIMTPSLSTLPWEDSDWFARVSAWIHAQLASHGLQTDNPIEVVHQRIWSAFLQVQTAKGMVYFKAPAPIYAFEAPLTQALTHWQPRHTAPLLAVNLEEGWILSEDAGVMIRASGDPDTQRQHIENLLGPYADFQIGLAKRVPELLAMGVPDRRLAALPTLYAELLEDTENLRVGLSEGITAEDYQQARTLQPMLAEWCQQLASVGLPETLAHEELTLPNVLVGARGYTYIDWSDCSVAHPCFTMIVTLRSTAYWLKLDKNGSEVQRLRDAYLEPWTTFAPRAQLNEALDLALRLGSLNRALSWQNTLRHLSNEQKQDYLDYVPEWLQDFVKNVVYVEV